MNDRSPEDVERRLRAKRYNERLKLFAGTLNTIGLTVLGAAVLLPMVAGAINPLGFVWIILSIGLHLGAQVVLHRLRSED